jgi:DNA polymerase III alpha subunit (gram-positive type)
MKYQKVGDKLKLVGVLDQFINPGCHIPEFITNINHISDDTVKNAPKEAEAFKIIREFFGKDFISVGYNQSAFDTPFLNNAFLRVLGDSFTPLEECDVLKMSKECLDLPHYKLINVCEKLRLSDKLEFHHSIDDVRATARIFGLLQKYYAAAPAPSSILHFQSMRYWKGQNHYLERCYVNCDVKVFYDVYKKRWASDDESIDLDKVRETAFMIYNVSSEKELVQKLKA